MVYVIRFNVSPFLEENSNFMSVFGIRRISYLINIPRQVSELALTNVIWWLVFMFLMGFSKMHIGLLSDWV